MTDDKAIIERAERMRKARQDRHLTQAEVAKRAGISENHYAQIERGEKNPSLSIFDSILDALGAASKDILGK